MTFAKQRYCVFGCAFTVLCALAVDLASAQEPAGRFRKPVYRVPRNRAPQTPARQPRRGDLRVANNDPVQAAVANHPLQPLIRRAQFGLDHIRQNVTDYTTTLAKREKVGDEVREYEYIFTKVRHEQARCQWQGNSPVQRLHAIPGPQVAGGSRGNLG